MWYKITRYASIMKNEKRKFCCVNMDRKQGIHFKRKEIQRREQDFKVNKILKFSNSKFELDSVRT